MPWIEPRGNRHRVYWYQDPARKRGKTYESFATGEQASQFKKLVDALGGDVSAARRFLREEPTAEATATSAPGQPGSGSPESTSMSAAVGQVIGVSRLCEVFLDGKTGAQPRTLKDCRRDLENFVKVYFGPLPVSALRAKPSLAGDTEESI